VATEAAPGTWLGRKDKGEDVRSESEGTADADASEVTSEGEAGADEGSTERKDGASVGF
jgi:hypothetical protein